MAMEDAYVLAEVLRSAVSIEDALATLVRRRKPRVEWVQGQSRSTAASLALPVGTRNAALRERGVEIFQDRYRPLVSHP